MTKEELIQAIESMTVLELSELVKALEEKIRRFCSGSGSSCGGRSRSGGG